MRTNRVFSPAMIALFATALALGAIVLLSSIWGRSSYAAPVVCNDSSDSFFTLNPSQNNAFQTFTTTASGSIDDAVLNLWRSSFGSDGSLALYIYPVDGSHIPTGSPLGVAVNSTADLTTTDPGYNCTPTDTFASATGATFFDFTGSTVTLDSSTEYALYLIQLTGTRAVYWSIDNASPYDDGQFGYFAASVGVPQPDVDAVFAVHGGFTAPTPTPTPTVTPTPTYTPTPTATPTPTPPDAFIACNDPTGGSQSVSTSTVAKAFSFTPDENITLHSVIGNQWRGSTGTPGNINVYLVNASSSADEPDITSILVSKSKSVSSFPTSQTARTCDPDTFTGTSPQTWNMDDVSLSAYTEYWIVFEITGSQSFFWAGQFGAATVNELCDSSDDGVTWSSCYTTWGLSYLLDYTGEGVPTPTPTPTPPTTPTPTPTPTPFVTDSEIFSFACSDPFTADYSGCDTGGVVPVVDSAVGGYDVVQPFTVSSNLVATDLWIELTKSGSPTTGLLGYLVELQTGSPKAITSYLASFGINSTADFTGGMLSQRVALSGSVVLTPGHDYGVLALGVCGSAGGCNGTSTGYFWNYATDTSDGVDAWTLSTAYNAYRSQTDIFNPLEWTDYPTSPTYVIQGFKLYGYSVGSGPTPTATPVPISTGPDPTSTDYNYVPDSLTKWIGYAPLTYSFTGMSGPVQFAIMRLDSEGNRTATLVTTTVDPGGGSTGAFSLSTSTWGEGPIVVYDVTNGQELVKHYISLPPSSDLLDARTHRCDATYTTDDCFVSLSTIGRLHATSGRLYQPGMSGQNEDISVNYGDTFRLWAAIPYGTSILPDTASTDRLVIYNVSTNTKVVDITFADLYQNVVNYAIGGESNTWIQLVLNTTGEELPYIQVRNLNDLYAVSFAPGVYNYAIVNATDAVIAEGESLLIVKPQNVSLLASLTLPTQVALNDTIAAKVRFGSTAICNGFLDWEWSIDPDIGIEVADTPDTCSTVVTANHTMPSSTIETLPKTVGMTLDLQPFYLPYSTEPSAYALEFFDDFQAVEQCGIVCSAGSLVKVSDENKPLVVLIVMAVLLVFGLVKGWPLTGIGMLEGITTGAFLWRHWIPTEIVVAVAVASGTIALAVWLLGRRTQ